MKHLFFCISLIAFLGGMSVACGVPQEQAQQLIQSRYDQFNEAWAGKDRKRVEEIFAPECKFKQTDGERTLSLPQFMSGIEFSFRAMKVHSVKTKIESVKLTGDTAEVVASTDTEVEIAGVEAVAKQSGTPVAKSTQKVRDTWKKTAAGWQIVNRLIEG